MTTKNLLEFFAENKKQGIPLVLASVYETQGATYSKAGARMLITGDGKFQGMLSGGCLEGDLAERAMQVIATGESQCVTYDLAQDDEDLWGLGVGCDGLMRIFLQPLLPMNNYEPFTAMSGILEGDRVEIAATVVVSACDMARAGDTLVSRGGKFLNFGLRSEVATMIERNSREVLTTGQSVVGHETLAGEGITVLYAVLRPPPMVLVLGAGLDAEPVVRLCAELGWRVTIQDHRPAYIEKGNFSQASAVICNPADSLSSVLDLGQFDAAIVMSHHLTTDRMYLDLLAQTEIPYVGLLGPQERRERLMLDMGSASIRLEGRLHGPAGLDIGGRGPAAIALSIIAQMHLILASRPLSVPAQA